MFTPQSLLLMQRGLSKRGPLHKDLQYTAICEQQLSPGGAALFNKIYYNYKVRITAVPEET